MPGVLDAQLHVGVETTYGTAVTPTRSFEPYSDNAKRMQEFLESAGMRAQMETIRSDRRRPVNMGGEDSLEVDVQNKGLGMFLRAMLADSTVAQVGATTAYLQTHNSTHEASDDSLTVQWGRPPISGTVIPFTYSGGMVASWTLSQNVGELLKLTLDMDYQDSTTGVSLASAAYPASTRPYGWDDVAVLIDSTSVDCVSSFSLTYDNMLNVDRRFLRGTVLKKQPIRAGVPMITGEIAVEFTTTTQYNSFITGATFPLSATWTGGIIEGTYTHQLVVTLAAIQYDGDANPVVSLDDLPRQPLPFKVLDNGTDPAVRITYRSTDTAF
jgi:hypothetical protein